MTDLSARRKAAYLLVMIANLAVDLMLPTAVLLALTPTGMSAAIRLSLGGTLLAGKAIGGRVETGVFRWRIALLVGLVPAAAILVCYAAGFGERPAMVAGAVIAALIVVGDLLRGRTGEPAAGIDAFAFLVLVEVVASVVVTSIAGDARFVLARPSIYLAVAGFVVLASAWSPRPLMRTVLKPVATQGDPVRAEAFERTWRRSQRFRGLYRVMTAGLGAVLLADAVLRVVVIYGQPAAAVTETSLTSQIPLVVLLGLWFAAGRGLAVPRAQRLLEKELAKSRLAPRGA